MDNKSSSRGIGILGVLTIVFIVLRLIGVIEWSWVWVLAPTWIPAAIGLVLLLIYIVILRKETRNIRSRKSRWMR